MLGAASHINIPMGSSVSWLINVFSTQTCYVFFCLLLLTGVQGEGGTPEPKVYSEEVCHHENGLAYSLSDSDTEHLSSSLEAEHR